MINQMVLNSSSINADTAASVLNNTVDKINEMIKYQKEFQKYIVDLTSHWKGGGSSKNSSLLAAVEAAKQMYGRMTLAIAFGMQLVVAVKSASNVLYRAYSGTNVELFM